MTLGFSPGVWKLERFFGLTPVPEQATYLNPQLWDRATLEPL